jgi:DNA-binding MarR family transcriptional regulator
MPSKNKPAKMDDIDYQMYVIRDFLDAFYDKTIFKSRRAADTELPPSSIKFLFAFTDENTAYPIGTLGENSRVNKSTMTDMVDRMERDRMAERIRDKKDRRVVKVKLTKKGKQVRREFLRKRRAEFQSIFSQLTSGEIKRFVSYLEKASEILKKID